MAGTDLITADDFDFVRVQKHPHITGGVQYILTFRNGWGASIIHSTGSYGIELGLLGPDGRLDMETLGPDVHGWLDREGLYLLLRRIEALPPKQAAVEGRKAVES